MAGSQGPYGDELWPDEEALAINEFDASLAGAWRIGRGAGRLFDHKRGNHVMDVLNDPRQARFWPLVRYSGAVVMV